MYFENRNKFCLTRNLFFPNQKPKILGLQNVNPLKIMPLYEQNFDIAIP